MKITQDKENCIGCGSCSMLCPDYWEMSYDEGKVILKGGKDIGGGKFELEIAEIECNQDAADSCPVQVIKIEK